MAIGFLGKHWSPADQRKHFDILRCLPLNVLDLTNVAAVLDEVGNVAPLEQASRTSKAMKLPRKKLQPGEIALPTPVIRRARGHQLSSPLQQPLWTESNTAGDGKKHFTTMRGQRSLSVVSELELELQPLRSHTSSAKFSLYESLLRALHSLLTATAEPSLEPRGGKSLMAMCLRKLPEYIGEMEYWEQRDAEEQGTKSTLQDSKVSSEVYEEIVAMLPPARNGCPQLRQLVRAHGLRLIRNAMAEDLLEYKFAISLIKLCSKMKAHLEAEGLLETLLDLGVGCSGNAAPNVRDAVYPKPKCMDSTFEECQKLAPLKALRDFTAKSERPQFMLRQLSRLMSKQKLPLEWLSTREFVSIWSGIIRTLSGNKLCDDTVSFAIHTITALASQARKTVYSLKPAPTESRAWSQQTLLSTIGTVATLPLLQYDAANSFPHGKRQDDTSATSQRVQHIIKSCIYEMGSKRKPTWITTVLNLGALYSTMPRNGSCGREEAFLIFDHSGILRSLKEARQHREAATALICTLAQYLGRGASEASHNSLTRLLDRLDIALRGEETIPRGLRADCAFFLAERTHDLRDLAFAESFNEATSVELGVQPILRRPASSPSAKFRWDEGIAEWVTATPAAPEKQPPRRSLRGRSSRSDVETCQEASAELENCSLNGVSDDTAANGDSAKHPACKEGTKRRRSRTNVARTRKRKLASAGLLLMQSENEEDDDDERHCNIANARSRYRGGQDNNGASSLSGQEPKRRRAAALKPYRSILNAISNTGGAESSEDELGL